MRKTIAFIIFFIIIFLVNVLLSFLSDDYKLFLKKIKGTDNDLSTYTDNSYNKNTDETFSGSLDQELEIIETNSKNEEIFIEKNNENSYELKQDIKLGKNYTKIIKLFSIYNLSKLEINSNLFDITDEYPDNYFEYYSKDLTLYLFPTRNYREIYDIFAILQAELPIKINEVNNFGENSFYINLNEDIDDKFIRLIISHKGIVFGLKINKTEYNLVKEKLQLLK